MNKSIKYMNTFNNKNKLITDYKFNMSSSRNGGQPYSFTSFKSNQSYENYQPQYFGVRTPNEPRMFSTFNSLGTIPSNATNNEFKMYPTATSIKNIAENQNLNLPNSQIDTFKNMMLIAAANKWT